MLAESLLSTSDAPTAGADVPYQPILAPEGDVIGIAYGVGPAAMPRAAFNTYIWPLLSDLARFAFANDGAAEVYR